MATSTLAGCGLMGGDDASELRTAADLPPPDARDAAATAPQRTAGDVQDFPVVLGAPYRIGNQVFAPFDRLSFDEVGYAAVISPAMEGRPTVNNERTSARTFTAAHRTLPVPSYVEVTALENGRTILVRVNDRGPMLPDRTIALSMAAAAALGVSGDGMSAVRVRRVNPPEQERAMLRAGGRAAPRLETPLGLRNALKAKLPPVPAPLSDAVPMQAAAPSTAAASAGVVQTVDLPPASLPPAPVTPPAATPAPAQDRFIVEQAGATQSRRAPGASFTPPPLEADRPMKGGFVVQVGAFSDQARASAVAQATGAQLVTDGRLYRVRTTVYRSAAEARQALSAIHAKGYAEARVVAND